MDEIINDVNLMGHLSVKIICYDDDAVNIIEDEDNFHRIAKKFNVSVHKSVSITISKQPRRCMYKQTVNDIMGFKYLGGNITSNRNLQE